MRSLIAAVLVLAVMGGAWWLARSHGPGDLSAPAGDGQTDDRPSVEAPVAQPPGAVPQADAPPFRERLRIFLIRASELSAAQRHAEADALRQATRAREVDGSLLPAESAYIQLALLKAMITDQDLLRRESEALLARYRTASAQGWEEYRRRVDPRHKAYREAESELIRRAQEEEVSDAQLRERLQALREQYYE